GGLTIIALVLAVASTHAPSGPGTPAIGARAAPGQAVLADGFGQLPLAFVTNAGQADPWAGYYVQGDATSVLFGPGGLSFRQWQPPARTACPHRSGRGLCRSE